MSDPVLASIRGLVELFEGDLSSVRFPDVDRDVLAKSVDQVMAAAEAVARSEAALAAARGALAEQQDALLGKAHRALSYARIYAEDDAGLAIRLDGIALPKRGKIVGRTDVVEGEMAVGGPASLHGEAPVGRKRGRREAPPANLFTPVPEHAESAPGA